MLKYATGTGDGAAVSVETVESAIELTRYLKSEMIKMHRLIYERDMTDLLPEIQRNIYHALPEEVRTADVIKLFKSAGLSERTGKRLLADPRYFKRVQFGVYHKTVQTDN